MLILPIGALNLGKFEVLPGAYDNCGYFMARSTNELLDVVVDSNLEEVKPISIEDFSINKACFFAFSNGSTTNSFRY